MKVLLVLSILLCVISIQAYNSYKLAVELPGAVCRSQSCNAAFLGNLGSYTLNLHGLWPNTDDGSIAQDCLVNSYDESQLTSNVLNQLNSEWVGLYSSSSSFRSHEWGKHGTCWAVQNENPSLFTSFLSYGVTTTYYQAMNDYFQKVIDVKNSLNLESAIFQQKTAERQTTLPQIKAALSNLLGVNNFDLTCNSNRLQEIRFCLNLNYQPIECKSASIQCSSTSPIIIIGVIN